VDADLVVDASGRSSRLPAWLHDIGVEPAKETVVDAKLGYATQLFEIPPGLKPDWKGTVIQPAPPAMRRCGYMFLQENGQWICTLIGYGGDYPPGDEQGFLEFARSLRDPLLWQVLKAAKPVGNIAAFRQTANRRRHLASLRNWPEGFVALGDSACAFNPVYGQGMSVAGKYARALDHWLSARGAPTRSFQQEAAKVSAGAWTVATMEDHRYTDTSGDPATLYERALIWYVVKALGAATTDRTVCAELLQVLGLVREPTALLHPRVMRRVFLT